jgi:TonB family protein
MRLIIPSLLPALICCLSLSLPSFAQSGKPDSTVAAPAGSAADIARKQKTEELLGKAKGAILVGPYEKVEVESEFPGGSRAWFNFLNTHLTYPKKAVRKRIEGTVLLEFIVDKDGSISDLKVLSGDPILAEAALKAMEDSPRWKPAMQNGRLVKSYKKQPIIFRLESSK